MPVKEHAAVDKPLKRWQQILHEVIFEADTRGGKLFDVALLIAILGSIAVVMMESVNPIYQRYGTILRTLEWTLTVLFTVEYVLRLLCVKKAARYAFSFFGIVDFLAVIPSYLSLVLLGSQYLIVIRAIRLLRVFRIFKLARYLDEQQVIVRALRASRPKITVFVGAIFAMVVILGTLMYLIEGGDNGFTSIPRSVYWAVVTLTTVGYGDIAPQTFPGQVLASIIMVLGYSIIAVPTGIVTVEIARVKPDLLTTQTCPSCASEGHDRDARYCKYCGARL